MWAFLTLGFGVGLSAGISPGPLLALVIGASLRSGWAGGMRVALAPLLTDAPIIALAVLLVGHLQAGILAWVGTLGGLVVIWMGVEALRSARAGAAPGGAPPGPAGQPADPRQELRRGMLVNVLNPHPYLFWATVGGPALVTGWHISPWHGLAFIVPFYLVLVGSKLGVAWLVSRGAGGLSASWYRRVLGASSLLMVVMGGLLIYQSWSRL